MGEKVHVILDCWRVVDTLLERIFRGLYVRCFLLFTDHRIVELKTSHYDISPPTIYTLSDAAFVGDSIISYLVWGPINYFFHQKIAEKLKKEGEMVEKSSRGISLDKAIEAIHHAARSLGIRTVKHSRDIPYTHVITFDVSNKILKIELFNNKTIKYHCLMLDNEEKVRSLKEALSKLIRSV